VGDDVDCSEVSGCSDGVVGGDVEFGGVVECADLGAVSGVVVCGDSSVCCDDGSFFDFYSDDCGHGTLLCLFRLLRLLRLLRL
jgi:hypothetical protein